MTREKVDEALSIVAEIDHLKHFTSYCRKCWGILRIQRYKKIRFQTSYGALDDSMQFSKELTDKILDTIENYISDKEKELEEL